MPPTSPNNHDEESSLLKEEPEYHRAEWRFERIMSLVILALVAVAVAGFFGGGPVAEATVESDGASLEYHRISRTSIEADLLIRLPPLAEADQEIRISQDYLRRFELLSIVPEPTENRTADQNAIWKVRGTPGEPGTIRVHFRIRETSYGIVDTVIEVAGRRFPLRQYIWP